MLGLEMTVFQHCAKYLFSDVTVGPPFQIFEMAVAWLASYNTEIAIPQLLAYAEEVSSYGWWARGTLREFLRFTGRTLVRQLPEGKYLTVELSARAELVAHGYRNRDGLAVVTITRRDYPTPLAYRLLDQARDYYPDTRWLLEDQEPKVPLPIYQQYLTAYQDPAAQPLPRVLQQIEEVQQTARSAVEKLLVREQDLQQLVQQSTDLSESSKKFFSKGEDLNSCCWRWLGYRRSR